MRLALVACLLLVGGCCYVPPQSEKPSAEDKTKLAQMQQEQAARDREARVGFYRGMTMERRESEMLKCCGPGATCCGEAALILETAPSYKERERLETIQRTPRYAERIESRPYGHQQGRRHRADHRLRWHGALQRRLLLELR